MEALPLADAGNGEARGEERFGDKGMHLGDKDEEEAEPSIAIGYNVVIVSHENLPLTLDDASEEEGELNWKGEVGGAAVHADGGEIFVEEFDGEGR